MAAFTFAFGIVMLVFTAIFAVVLIVSRWTAGWFGPLNPRRFTDPAQRRLAWRYLLGQFGSLLAIPSTI